MSVRATVDPKIGARIRARRESIEMTLKRLAYEAKTSKSHLSKIERGENVPSIELLLRIAKALDCKAGLLLGEH
jgi:transcriptional regulator with XRE-family HTH domain